MTLAALHPLVMGRAAELSPRDPHVGQGKSCLPTGARQGRGENQWVFLNFSVFHWRCHSQSCPSGYSWWFCPRHCPFLPFLSQTCPDPPARKLAPFAQLTLCLPGRMNLEGCVYPAQGKRPEFWLNSPKRDVGYFPILTILG